MSAPIGVVGLGLLGRGITACLLERGFEVIAVVPTDEEHAAALPLIERAIGELVDHGAAPQELLAQWRSRLVSTTHWEPLADCNFVIESVNEDLALKQSVFHEIERIVGEDVVIASNTSAIPISVLQQKRRHPQRFVGMHWAEPAHATRFLELIRGAATSDETMRRAAELGRRLGKDPTICQRDVPGFIVNRIAYAMYREALHLVETGVADVETIDRSLRNTLGLWAASCGPFRWIDLTGGPTLYGRAMQHVAASLRSDSTPSEPLPESLAELVRQDARGISNGHGFYQYTPEEASIWEDRQRRHAWKVKAWLDAEFPIRESTDPPD